MSDLENTNRHQSFLWAPADSVLNLCVFAPLRETFTNTFHYHLGAKRMLVARGVTETQKSVNMFKFGKGYPGIITWVIVLA